MCLSVPARVIEINGEMAKASIGGSVFEIGLHLVDNVEVGDYVLVHTGFALEKIDPEEACKLLQMLKELDVNKDYLPEN